MSTYGSASYGSASYGCFTYGGSVQPPAADVRSGRGGASYLRGLHYHQARAPTDEQRRRRLRAEQLILLKA